MGKFIMTANLTKEPNHAGLAETYLGMANIAGTGPKGKTCRECVHWCRDLPMRTGDTQRRKGHLHLGWITNHGELRRAYCNYPIAGKAHNLYPHKAKACSLFEQSENPPLIVKPKKEKAT